MIRGQVWCGVSAHNDMHTSGPTAVRHVCSFSIGRRCTDAISIGYGACRGGGGAGDDRGQGGTWGGGRGGRQERGNWVGMLDGGWEGQGATLRDTACSRCRVSGAPCHTESYTGMDAHLCAVLAGQGVVSGLAVSEGTRIWGSSPLASGGAGQASWMGRGRAQECGGQGRGVRTLAMAYTHAAVEGGRGCVSWV